MRSGRGVQAGTQKVRQVAYFWLAGSPAQDGCAARLGRGHHQGHGGPHAGQAQGEIYPVERSAPPQCHGDALQFHLGTHGRQPGQVDVHGTGAQLAAAGQRQAHLAHPAEQRRQVEHRAAHGPGEVVGNLPLQVLAGGNEQVTPLPFGLGTHGLQQRQAGGDIGQGRHGPQAAGGTAQQGGSQQRQYAVFGGGGPYAAVKRPPAGNGDKLHGYPLLRWLCVEIVEDVGTNSVSSPRADASIRPYKSSHTACCRDRCLHRPVNPAATQGSAGEQYSPLHLYVTNRAGITAESAATAHRAGRFPAYRG